MKNFSTFYFKNFEFDISNLQAIFHYSFDNEVFFEEIIDFKNDLFFVRDDLDLEILNNILFHLHIALWISYYKAFPTKDLVVESGFLDDFQIEFWKKFYINWLWEFLYTNKISPSGLFNFVNNSSKKYSKIDFEVSNKVLIAIWWWKDSIVTIELFKKAWIDFDLNVFWKIDQLKNNTALIANKNILQVKRTLSANLFELNKTGYYNGHIPITWIIAFVMEMVAYIYSYKYLVLSNEKSANFWNTLWEWLVINHQYSKSLDFEKDFGEYVFRCISSDVKYFSVLRWMYEVKIAELFVKYWKQYFWMFSSCNSNFKINNDIQELKDFSQNKWIIQAKYWCNNCPKCAFVFSILRPYLTDKEVIQIFWEDLYFRQDLEKLFRELLWISWIKPFECVWEAEEVIYSMYLSIWKYSNLPFILDIFSKEVLINLLNNDIKNIKKKLVTIYNEDIIPLEIKKILKNNLI